MKTITVLSLLLNIAGSLPAYGQGYTDTNIYEGESDIGMIYEDSDYEHIKECLELGVADRLATAQTCEKRIIRVKTMVTDISSPNGFDYHLHIDVLFMYKDGLGYKVPEINLDCGTYSQFRNND